MQYKCITKKDWDKTIEQLLLSYSIFASTENDYGLDYEIIGPMEISRISYNRPKPATSLKSFFLPVKENVTSERASEKPRIILGIPNCDIEGLSLLDEIYLDEGYNDIFYRKRRENTLLISNDCFGKGEHCHCLSYDIKPYSVKNADLAIIRLNDTMIIRIITDKGEEFLKKVPSAYSPSDMTFISDIEREHQTTESILSSSNKDLPGYKKTGMLLSRARQEIWQKYSARCISCGACTAICPTCTCFLLIDNPGFEKVKQMDTCQYPGFGRIAGGEDALFELPARFRNRYMCKYVWKPEKFNSLACTGCGRCIEACIGMINKNELFIELEKQEQC